MHEFPVFERVQGHCTSRSIRIRGPKTVRTSFVGIYAARGPLEIAIILVVMADWSRKSSANKCFSIVTGFVLTGMSSRFLGGQDSFWPASSLILHQEEFRSWGTWGFLVPHDLRDRTLLLKSPLDASTRPFPRSSTRSY